MKSLKKLSVIAAAAVMVCCLAACGGAGKDNNPTPTPTANVSVGEKYISLLEDVTVDNLEEGQLPVKAVLASGIDGTNESKNCLDGDMESRWTGAYGAAWIMFDMGESVTVNSVEMAMWYGSERVYPFTMEVSDDAENWTAVTEKIENKKATDDFETYAITSPKAGRYIRYNGDGSTTEGKKYCHISEIKLYK